MTGVLSVLLVLACAALWHLWRRQVALRREAWIRSFQFPQGLFDRVRRTYPHLSLKDCQLVAQGLRQFFLAHLKSRRAYVSMPSQVADALWHEFILSTRQYHVFCGKAFGRFLHHTPAVALQGGQRQSNAGLRRCFWYACLEEQINPRAPRRLPLLFALDAKLAVPDGYRYVADCSEVRREGDATTHCGAELSGESSDGGPGSDGDGGTADGGGDGGDGGGDGGSGCGGGGCGGGGGD